MQYSIFLFTLFLTITTYSFASRLDPIIVTSKTGASSSKVLSTHTVIDDEEIESNITSNTIDILKNVPGITIVQAGGPGAQASLYIRGSESRHVLVLIDGVKVNDPSNPDKQFNAANLASLDIEKIEVIKGAQSVLYGSDAIGGVINIITKKGEVKPRFGVELGFQNSINASVTKYSKQGVTYLNAYISESEGISARKNGSEKDGYSKKGMTLNHSQAFESFELDWMLKFMSDTVEDDSFGVPNDSQSNTKTHQQLYKQSIKFSKLKIQTSVNRMDRLVTFLDGSTYTETNYVGQSIINDFVYLHSFETNNLAYGLTHEYESFSKSHLDSKKSNLYSAYFAFDKQMTDYLFNIGFRNDKHESFGSMVTYNIALAKNLEQRRQIKIHYATGFKAPSIYQLYVAYDAGYKVGNEDLKPEQSRTFDISFLKKGNHSFEVSYFNNFIYDYFYYDSTDGYLNKGSFNATGIELSANQEVSTFTFRERATFSEFHLSGDAEVLRRPEQQVLLGLDHHLSDKLKVSMDWKWLASRFDKVSGNEIILDAYDITNISIRYQNGDTSYQLGAKNIFDREYTEVYDYNTLGLTIFAKASFTY